MQVYEAGDVVASPTDPDSDGIFFVAYVAARAAANATHHHDAAMPLCARLGRVELRAPSSGDSLGAERYTLLPGSMIGQESVILGKPRQFTAVAATKVHGFMHPAQPFRRMLDANPHVRSVLEAFLRSHPTPSAGRGLGGDGGHVPAVPLSKL